MTFRAGQIYRDKTCGATFLVVLERMDNESGEVLFKLVNMTNWIVFKEHSGKQSASGDLLAQGLDQDHFEFVAPSLKAYFKMSGEVQT